MNRKKLDGNYSRMLRAILNKSWRQHPTKQQLYGHLQPITKTIKIWRSWDELISDVFLWTPSHGWAKAGHPAQTYIQQLCTDMGCSPEDLPKVMDDREAWQERVRNIHADSATSLYQLQYKQNRFIARTMYQYFFIPDKDCQMIFS